MKYLINRGGRLWEEKVDIEFVSKLDTYLDRGGAHRERKTKMLVETVCRGQCLWEGIHPFVPEWALIRVCEPRIQRAFSRWSVNTRYALLTTQSKLSPSVLWQKRTFHWNRSNWFCQRKGSCLDPLFQLGGYLPRQGKTG